MRTIEYRGKRIHDNAWIYGNLIIDKDNNSYIIPNSHFELDGHHLMYDSDDSPVFIDEKTVGSSLCKKDNYGKKIYEGDIVRIKYKDEYGQHEEIVTVYYDKDDKIYPFCLEYECDGRFCFYKIYEVEVIGNIYDNAEKLER